MHAHAQRRGGTQRAAMKRWNTTVSPKKFRLDRAVQDMCRQRSCTAVRPVQDVASAVARDRACCEFSVGIGVCVWCAVVISRNTGPRREPTPQSSSAKTAT
ncbi:hypothetical protein OH77DRAFT_1050691 [Trametes cingulata]|nr:hypothetical protein OH77DRAFT_1050691 [Trametes cingulata]